MEKNDLQSSCYPWHLRFQGYQLQLELQRQGEVWLFSPPCPFLISFTNSRGRSSLGWESLEVAQGSALRGVYKAQNNKAITFLDSSLFREKQTCFVGLPASLDASLWGLLCGPLPLLLKGLAHFLADDIPGLGIVCSGCFTDSEVTVHAQLALLFMGRWEKGMAGQSIWLEETGYLMRQWLRPTWESRKWSWSGGWRNRRSYRMFLFCPFAAWQLLLLGSHQASTF